MNNILLYPFNFGVMPVLRHRDLLDNAHFYLLSPEAYFIENKDASYIDGGNPVGLEVLLEDEFSCLLEKVDTVVFNDFTYNLNFYNDILPKLSLCKEKKKKVIYLHHLNLDLKKILYSMFEKKINFDRCDDCSQLEMSLDLKHSDKLVSIGVPVIFVCGIRETHSNFEIELSLREKFLKDGYRVSQIGSSNYSCLYTKFHDFPEYIFNKNVLEKEKIILFNHYVHMIEKEEDPDVIIIGIPQPILNEEDEMKDLGVTALAISSAIHPDYVFMCIPYGNYDYDFFDHFSTLTEYRFEWKIDCFSMSNTIYSKIKSADGQNNYLKLSVDEVEEKIKYLKEFCGVELINTYNEKMIEEIYLKIVKEFEANYLGQIF